MKVININITPPDDQLEAFEERDQNIVNVRIQTPGGEMISGPGYRVELTLTRDAMMGLGTELIRAAHHNHVENRIFHLRPADSELASRILGVYLHPSSCELILAGVSFPPLEQLLGSERS